MMMTLQGKGVSHFRQTNSITLAVLFYHFLWKYFWCASCQANNLNYFVILYNKIPLVEYISQHPSLIFLQLFVTLSIKITSRVVIIMSNYQLKSLHLVTCQWLSIVLKQISQLSMAQSNWMKTGRKVTLQLCIGAGMAVWLRNSLWNRMVPGSISMHDILCKYLLL